MKSIAIITARGGSKRIPQKNIRDFCGQPIIAYSIQAALETGAFSEVMVSTDSEEIACIAKQNGATVPFLRSEKTSNDYATTADVLREVLDQYAEEGQFFDWFACLYPTAPFVRTDRLRNAAELLKESDSVISVVRYSFPPQRAFVIRNDKIRYIYPEFERTRSQDLEPEYHDCGHNERQCNIRNR